MTCETQLLSLKPNDQLKFCFFKSNGALESGCSSNPELHIPAIWTENSGGYWCTAGTTTSHIWKKSLTSLIDVQSEYQWVLRFSRDGSKKVVQNCTSTLGHCSLWKMFLISIKMRVRWEKRLSLLNILEEFRTMKVQEKRESFVFSFNAFKYDSFLLEGSLPCTVFSLAKAYKHKSWAMTESSD